jgi:hypothetical protein
MSSRLQTLVRKTAMADTVGGDGQAGEALLDRAVRQAETGDDQGTSPLDRARVIAERARHLITRGEPDQAGQLFQPAAQLFTDAGSEQKAAATGYITDIAYQRGDYADPPRGRR